MCTIPPAPPPPPPLPPQVLSDQHFPKKFFQNDNHNAIYNHLEVCEWASEYPQLWEACTKYSVCTKQTPFRFKFVPIESILQVGPTCGIAALSMLVKGEVTAEEIFDIAKLEGFSNNGEMFSCKYMAKLAERVFNLVEFDHVKFCVKNGGLFSKETIDKLLEGAVLLVPYDADCNHSPCLKNGHTAHWGIVCGVIIVEDPGEGYSSVPNNVYIVSRHGKSKFLAIWNIEDLEKSNKNLWEFSPKRGDDGLIYVLPQDGIGGENGLRNQFLIIEGL